MRLESLLHETIASGPPRSAVASLHLATKLSGFPAGVVRDLERRPDLETLLPDLGVFIEQAEIALLFEKQGTLEVWSTMLHGLDSREIYRLTFEEVFHRATQGVGIRQPSALGFVWKKISADLESRARFASLQPEEAADQLFRAGTIRVEGVHREVRIPLNGARICNGLAGSLASEARRLRTLFALLKPTSLDWPNGSAV